MKMLVCISHVPDTETDIRITADGSSIDLNGITWIINPWDELALTRAAQLRKEHPSFIESLTVVTVGGDDTVPSLRKALALGADNAVRIDADPVDSWFVASQIAEVIKRDKYDVVLTGTESSDFNGFAVGGMLAGITGYACLPNITSMNIEDNKIMVHRETEGGKERLEAEVPFIAVIQKGITSAPGIPTMRDIMQARNKPVEVLPALTAGHFTEYTAYSLPGAEKQCTIITENEYGLLAEKLYAGAGIG